MLFDDPSALEEYVKKSQNKHLLKWWAQYLESSQDMDSALEYYAAAEDTLQSLRYGWRHVRSDPCGTATQVAKVLRSRGWPGSPKPCSPGCPLAAAWAVPAVRAG